MQVDDLPAKLLVLLGQLGEYAIALLRAATEDALGRRRRRLKPLSPPPDLVLAAAAGRVLLLRQRLQPPPAQVAAQRAQTTAAQKLIHTQLRQRAVLALRLLVGVVVRRQIQSVVVLADGTAARRAATAVAVRRRLGKSGTARASDSLAKTEGKLCHAEACEAYGLSCCAALSFITDIYIGTRLVCDRFCQAIPI